MDELGADGRQITFQRPLHLKHSSQLTLANCCPETGSCQLPAAMHMHFKKL
jgi:hypothetical protein